MSGEFSESRAITHICGISSDNRLLVRYQHRFQAVSCKAGSMELLADFTGYLLALSLCCVTARAMGRAFIAIIRVLILSQHDHLGAIQIQGLMIQKKVHAATLTCRHRFIRHRQTSLITNCSHLIYWMADNVIEHSHHHQTCRVRFTELLWPGYTENDTPGVS